MTQDYIPFARSPFERFVMVRDSLWTARPFCRLTACARLILVEFMRRWGKMTANDARGFKYRVSGIRFGSKDAKRLGISPATFTTSAKALADSGFIHITPRPGRASLWKPSERWKRA